MSTWLYLECRSHDPILQADGESGQHLYDLEQILHDIRNRDLIVTAVHEDIFDGSDHFRANTARFLAAHPKCLIGVRDEYGREHYAEEVPVAAVADREGLAGVLRAHQPKGGIRDMRIHCMCGWSTDRKGSRTDHVADAVARWLTGEAS